jgi:hypothetical protein
MGCMSKPLEWTESESGNEHHAYREKAHYHAYEASDGGGRLVIFSMFTDDPNTVEEKLGEYTLSTLADAKVLAQGLADQRGWTW